MASQRPLSEIIRDAQLKLLEQGITNPDKQHLKEVAFHGKTLRRQQHISAEGEDQGRIGLTTFLEY